MRMKQGFLTRRLAFVFLGIALLLSSGTITAKVSPRAFAATRHVSASCPDGTDVCDTQDQGTNGQDTGVQDTNAQAVSGSCGDLYYSVTLSPIDNGGGYVAFEEQAQIQTADSTPVMINSVNYTLELTNAGQWDQFANKQAVNNTVWDNIDSGPNQAGYGVGGDFSANLTNLALYTASGSCIPDQMQEQQYSVGDSSI